MSCVRLRSRFPLLPSTSLLALFALAALAGTAAQAAPPAGHAIPIAAARLLTVGTTVTVDGSVSTPSDAFESSFFDKGFGLQDRSGGIFISLQTDLGVAPRRQARVTGTLQNSAGLLILVPADPSDVKLHGVGPKIRPEWVHTGAVGEGTEGRIVKVVAHVTQAPSSDLPFGFKFFVDDGTGELQIFVNTQTGIDLSGLTVGQLVSVTGFSSQFETHYEIDPRFPADITTPGH